MADPVFCQHWRSFGVSTVSSVTKSDFELSPNRVWISICMITVGLSLQKIYYYTYKGC